MKEVLLQWFMNTLIKKSPGGTFKCEFMINQHLAEEPHKSVIRKFKTKNIHLLKTIFGLLTFQISN